MAVYVDPIRSVAIYPRRRWPWRLACHLWADSREELLQFARRIGLRAEWLHKGRVAHFDLASGMRHKAIVAGANETTYKDWKRAAGKTEDGSPMMTQREIDFPRAEQLGILRDLILSGHRASDGG
ncbi:MAG TPA: DUF4031 domain-containing protein, partial [Phycisphaerae bacterium]|nr:DUF4031 domain-containing protein [Phycisphaerae bacterium]